MCRARPSPTLVTCDRTEQIGRLRIVTDVTRLWTLIVSGDRTFRSVLAGHVRLLAPWVGLIGEATTVEDALLVTRDRQPDLVLLDLSLWPGNPLRLVAHIRRQSPAAVVAIGNQPAAEYRDAAIAAGALDYVDVLELGATLPAVLERVPELIDCYKPTQPAETPAVVPQRLGPRTVRARVYRRSRTAPPVRGTTRHGPAGTERR